MFLKLIKENQERLKKIDFKPRDYAFYDDLLKLNKIITFVGPRRVWKTYLMFQFIYDLVNRWVLKWHQIVFIDFSIFRWEKIDPYDVLESYYSLWYDKEPFFVFDEIQDLENWQPFILSLFIQWYKIFVSGSNSKLLSSEIATQLRWRVWQYFVYPLTFQEVLVFKNISKEKFYPTEKVWKIKNLFLEILKYWNFPEVV